VAQELGSRVLEQHERLFLVPDGTICHFAQNIWLEAEEFSFASISQAVKHLRERQRNWWLHSVGAHRRAQLIQEQLPPLKPKPLSFPPAPLPSAPMGSWTLLSEGRMLFSARCSSPFADGEPQFAENKVDPPSRAYLKLWEFFTLAQKWPGAGEKVLDLGSSPGGWTWVLDRLGADVLSVDKAPLSEQTKFSARVRYLDESAFALKPKEKVDWLFSDIICYPDRLFELVERWREWARNMVCTIKFQGPTDLAAIEKFLTIPGSSVRHLAVNKHELTWARLAP
jgi:23S rRNA (cytidine2498-2'-O)-methyltransferase